MSDEVNCSGRERAIEHARRTRLKMQAVQCKNALVRSKIEGMDYALNPYTGCEHGCLYCYAEFMKKYTNHREPWGEFVDVKINVVERLKHQVRRAKPGVVMIGTVTDAYQPAEERFLLTRQCLEVLANSDFPVSIQTKSDLVLRDLDVLKRMKEREVGLTITSSDPYVEAAFEPGASDLDRRLEALRELTGCGIPAFAFVGPILPFFSDNVDSLKSVFRKLKKAKINKIYLDKMNYLKGKWKRISPVVREKFPRAVSFYQGVMANEESYADWLRENVKCAASRFSLESELLF